MAVNQSHFELSSSLVLTDEQLLPKAPGCADLLPVHANTAGSCYIFAVQAPEHSKKRSRGNAVPSAALLYASERHPVAAARTSGAGMRVRRACANPGGWLSLAPHQLQDRQICSTTVAALERRQEHG